MEVREGSQGPRCFERIGFFFALGSSTLTHLMFDIFLDKFVLIN